jgi:hypothetical protein
MHQAKIVLEIKEYLINPKNMVESQKCNDENSN